MRNLNINEKEVGIRFNKKFYNFDSIAQGKNDFKEICETEINEDSFNISVKLKPKVETELETLGREFCNYVFSLMKNSEVKW